MPSRTSEVLAQLPLSFEANQGQADSDVKFLSRGPSHALLLTSRHAVLQVGKSEARSVVTMELVGGTAASKIEPVEPQPGQINYLLGNDPAKWHIDVPHYARVRYREVYPGVDLVFYGNQQQLEYDLVVSPGADPRAIAVRFDGAHKLQLNAQGDLLIDTPSGAIEQAKPVVYQEVNGDKKQVDATYVLKGANEVGFQVATYDTAHALVIDPTLAFTYLGGDGDQATAIATDDTGNVYVAGSTSAANFSTTTYQGNLGGMRDGFITKFSPSMGSIIFSTYFGGNADDDITSIFVGGRAGNIYVAGSTSSTNLPTFMPFQSANAGDVDGFVARLNTAGNGLDFSSYLGATGEDRVTAIGLGPDDTIFTAGFTASPGFPTVNPIQPAFGGGPYDAFATAINPAGTQLTFSTFIGGGGSDQATSGVYEPSSGLWFLSGGTNSTNFPTTPGAYQAMNKGEMDAFMAGLDAYRARNGMATLFGGLYSDTARAIAAGPNGLVTLIGKTSSPDFPTFNPFQSTYGGGPSDAFVLVVNPTNPTVPFVNYSTFIGGSGEDSGNAIAVDRFGWIAFGGGTNSSNLPVVAPDQPGNAGGDSDCFFGVLPPIPGLAAQPPGTLSFYGGPGGDSLFAILFDDDPNRIRFYIGGQSFDRAEARRRAVVALINSNLARPH